MAVIARAPLRISLAGGGTDLPAYAERFGGLVVSTSINRYVYTILTPSPDDVLQITAADSSSILSRRDHLFDSSLFWGSDYRMPLALVDHFGVSGRRIFLASEVPPGTGLGSSSATAVSMIAALAADRGLTISKHDMADLACHVEIDQLGMPIGYQDQFAAAFGGLNVLEFGLDGTRVSPLELPPHALDELQQRCMLFFTGQRRRSTDILSAQRDATRRAGSDTLAALHEIKAFAVEMIAAVQRGQLDRIGELLDASWRRKQRLAPGVTNDEINGWYAAATEAGALGGKITGAGGGGFLLLYADPTRKPDVIRCMSEQGLVWVDADFDQEGASVLMGAPAGFAFR